MTDTATERIADAYLTHAYFSTVGRTKRGQLEQRHTSYGLLKALEILLGMEDACRLIEERHDEHHSARHTNVGALLYEFWSIDRPKERA